MKNISQAFKDSISLNNKIIATDLPNIIEKIGIEISNSIKEGNKIMLCGNGGSAADAQHLVAEMLIRLKPNCNRQGIPAISLAQDTSTITACGNDFGYQKIYERVIKSLGKKGDCLLGITTSGNSENVILAMKAAKDMGIKVFGFLGSKGGKAINFCDKAFIVPSNETARIQECHILAGHALVEYIEQLLLKANYLHISDEV